MPDDLSAPAQDRRYSLPEPYRAIFVELEDLNHLAPLAQLAVGAIVPIDRLLEAYRTGGAVPYEA